MSDQDNVELLRQVTGASDERIRVVLKRHTNLDMAVSALLDDQNDMTSTSDTFIGPLPGPLQAALPDDEEWNQGRGALNAPKGNRNNSPVQIDLTSPDGSTVGLAGSNFDHSDAEKAKWALVPTSTPSTAVYGPQPDPAGPYAATQRQQDDDLSLAISASLQTSMLDANSSAAFEELSLHQRIRLDYKIPVTLRSRNPHMIHVALLAHALYHVPQVRQAFKGVAPNVHTTSKEIASFWKVMARLEMGTQCDVVIDEFLPKGVRYSNEGSGMLKEVKESTEALYTRFAQIVLGLQPPFSPGLLYSKIWYPPSFGSGPTFWSSGSIPYSDDRETDTKADLPIIPITANVNSPDNSLLGYLHDLTWTRKLECAAEVLVFSVTHEDGPVTATSKINISAEGSSLAQMKGSSGPAQKHPLQYPARLYIDPFLLETREITSVQRETRFAMESTVRLSETRLSGLGGGSSNVPLKNLRASIKYFEELATDDDPHRRDKKTSCLAMLNHVLVKVESEIDRLREDIQRTKNDMAHVYDVTGLQKHPYNLYAVLMWDGVYGRTHTYSYVKAGNGKWYKSVESTVIEVDENTVLSDSTGLHMGAGPFMLLYSKETTPPLPSENSDNQEQGKMEQDAEKPERPAPPPRTYSSIAEEYSQWPAVIRQAIRNGNAQFRTALEDAGVVDADGRILHDSSSDQPARMLQEDPLARMYFEETEDSMEYDSDAQDIDQDVVMDTTASLAAWGLSTEPTVSQDSGISSWGAMENNVAQESDIASWGPQGDGSGWDDATKAADWGYEEEKRKWDIQAEADKAGWDQESSTDIKGIEVQVTRDVQSSTDSWRTPP